MKQLTLAPVHLFRFRDGHYALDVDSSAVVRLDGPAYDALALQAAGAAPEEIAGHLAATYGEEAGRAVQRELQYLNRRGIFRGPITTYDAEENRACIERLARMATTGIELTLAEACNLRCRYCYVDGNGALGNGLMPWEVAREAIDLVFRRAGDADAIHITFFGGEPLLNKPVLLRAIAYSQQLGAERGKRVGYSMTTNATLLDDEIIGLIKRYNFGLMISLDGPPDVHDRMRPFAGGQGSFERAASNIRRLMARRSTVTVRCTLSNQCLDRPRIVAFLEEFGFSRVAMSRCTGTVDCRGPCDIGPEENAVLQQQDDYFLDRLLAQLDRGEPIRFNPWTTAIRNIHDKQSRRMRCGVGRGCTTVGIDGKLYPCHRYVGMAPYVLGHVSTGIDPDRFARYLEGYFSTKAKCERCWAINICGGYCPWYVSCQDGSFRPPEDWWCAEVLTWYEQAIWLYDTLRTRHPAHFRRLVGDGRDEPVLR